MSTRDLLISMFAGAVGGLVMAGLMYAINKTRGFYYGSGGVLFTMPIMGLMWGKSGQEIVVDTLSMLMAFVLFFGAICAWRNHHVGLSKKKKK